MKRIIMLTMLFLGMFCFLSGCCLSHDWQEATCAAPRTCAKCEKTEGTVAAHNWQAATCQSAETCALCGAVQGEPLTHIWEPASCQKAENCTLCGEIRGEPLPHIWKDATCQKARHCTVCDTAEGEPLRHIFKRMVKIFGDKWEGTCILCEGVITGEAGDTDAFCKELFHGTWLNDMSVSLPIPIETMEVSPDGTCQIIYKNGETDSCTWEYTGREEEIPDTEGFGELILLVKYNVDINGYVVECQINTLAPSVLFFNVKGYMMLSR